MKIRSSMKDCIIIGGGPAGLTAGIYLKRFRRNIVLIDNKQSRAELIYKSHNYPGFPEGISGNRLLDNLRQQFHHHNGEICIDTVTSVNKNNEDYFIVSTNQQQYMATKIILATGVIDIEPELPDIEHAVKRGLIRHCAVCDGYEVIDQKIGIIGFGKQGMHEAIFLNTYSKDITLLTLGKEIALTENELKRLQKANIKIIFEPALKVNLIHDKVTAIQTKNNEYHFDTIYSALGAKIRSDIAIKLGAKHINECLIVDRHQETTISGLFAAGDIVHGLNQICVATGQAAIAATEIHNQLASR